MTRGSSTAPVVVIEWSDYECPFCSKAERETLPKLDELFIHPGKVQLVFRHLPLEQIHRRAATAAQAALCAGADGRFWEMHAALFAAPDRLDEESLLKRARDLRIDEAQFLTCVSGPRDSRLVSDLETAKSLRLTATPVFLVGVRRPDGRVDVAKIVSGARPINEFIEAIEPLLASGRTGTRSVSLYFGTGAGLFLVGSAVVWRWRGRRRSREMAQRDTPK
jgi:protein-disulfide isomerase